MILFLGKVGHRRNTGFKNKIHPFWVDFVILIFIEIMLWRIRRQIFYTTVFLIIIFAPVVIYLIIKQPPQSCFDGKQNQKELGIDCGGPCSNACDFEVASHVIEWQRIFESRPGEYYIAALVENPNTNFTAREFTYTFEVYDTNNKLLLTKTGKNKSNPRERFILFDSGINISSKPARVFLNITDVSWEHTVAYSQPKLTVKNEELSLFGSPRLTASIMNEEMNTFNTVEVSTIIFNEESNIIAVSQTQIKNLDEGERESIFFTWPQTFKEEPRICIDPVEVMLVFDRSGSMNDDGSDPPQPLTDAKDAARLFINQVSDRDKVGVVSFATTARDQIDQLPSIDKEMAKEAVSNISILPEDETGFTNLGDGILKAWTALQKESATDSVRKVLVILTDGKANAPKVPGGEIHAKKESDNAKGLGYELYTIGLGNAVNQSFLRDIASSPEYYYFSATSNDLKDIYTEIATSVCPERIYLTRIFIRPINADF